MDTPLVIITNYFEIILDRKFQNNKSDEETISIKDVTFKDNFKTETMKFNRELFKSNLLGSKIYIRHFLGSYEINLMIFPWFEPNDDRNVNSFILNVFRLIILRIINFYYYIESMNAFSILTDYILDTKTGIRLFKSTFYNKKNEEKVMEYIFTKNYEDSDKEEKKYPIYHLQLDKFKSLEDSSNSEDKSISKLYKVTNKTVYYLYFNF